MKKIIDILLMVKIFLWTMIVFIVQKVFFMAMTWQDGTGIGDVLNVIWNGMTLDMTVACYILSLPLLLLTNGLWIKGRWLTYILWVYMLIISLLVAIIIVSDASLYPFWHFKLDSTVFLYTDKPKDAMASVSIWFVLWRIILIALWTAGQYIGYHYIIKIFDKERLSLSRSIKHKAVLTVIYIIIGGILFLGIRGGVGKGTSNVTKAYFTNVQYLNHSAVNPIFNLIYSMGDNEDYASEAQFLPVKEAETIAESIYPLGKEEQMPDTSLLKTDRPDILLIIWEGGNIHMLKDLKAGPETMRLAQEGIDFTECYANSFRTDRGQFSLLSGWPAIPKTSLIKIPEKYDHLPALPRTLFDNGYSATFWYGGDISFACTGAYMHQIGFQKTISDKDFTENDIATEWGVYDGTLLKKMGDTMIADKTGRSFHCVMTLSSHEPWTVPVNKFANERLNAFYYTDKCIGEFIERLRKSPLWKNLLVIITADHGVSIDDKTGLHNPDVTHIPMIWVGGAVKNHREINTLVNQSDLPATLLGQLGIKHTDFVFSRDVLSPSYIYPCIFHTYNGGVSFADSTGYTTYDMDGQCEILGPNAQRARKAKGILQWLYKKIAEL